MRLMIYAVGGDYAEQLVGCAYDYVTACSLVRFLRYTGARACSVHGPLAEGREPLSGEVGLGALEDLLYAANVAAKVA